MTLKTIFNSTIAFVVLLAGCNQRAELPETVPELAKVVSLARDNAKLARENQDAAAANAEAELALAAFERLQKVAEEQPEGSVDHELQKKARSDWREASRWAELAQDEYEHREALRTWKAKSYIAVRGGIWKGVCLGLAKAADQAHKNDIQELDEFIRQSAELGARTLYVLTDDETYKSKELDWQAAATTLRKFADSPPPTAPLMVALALLLSCQEDFALYEIEQVEKDDLLTNDKIVLDLFRARLGFVTCC